LRTSGAVPGGGGEVIFGEVEFEDALVKRACACQKVFWKRMRQKQILQGGGSCGVVINANRVGDPGDGAGQAGAETNGTKEAVLKPDDLRIGGDASGINGVLNFGVEGAAPNDKAGILGEGAQIANKGDLGLWEEGPNEGLFPWGKTQGEVRSLKTRGEKRSVGHEKAHA